MSESDNEAFPNAEQLFCDAFALPNPAPELLNLLKTHPTDSAANALVNTYTVFAEEHLSRAHELAEALVSVRDSPDLPIFPNGELNDTIADYLILYHEYGLDMNMSDDGKPDRIFGPADAFLVASLLSGMSLKYRLTECSDQYGNIEDGLDAPEGEYSSEVLLAGACIQLLVAGSEIMPAATFYLKSAENVANKLNAQKSAGTLKNPNALKLLELTILHAETGFKRENDIDNVWQILFPS